MSNLIRTKWFVIFCGSVLLMVWGTACDCGNKPPASDGTVLTDGGTSTDTPLGEGGADEARTCQQRCDCPQGQECSEGKCIFPTTPVYCCSRDNCPQGLACVDTSGKSETCGARPQCKQACDCDQGLACVDGFCTKTDSPVYCCEKSGCKPGSTCLSFKGGARTCGNEGSACTSACDCVTGLGCTNGVCTKASTPIYCCSADNCPTGKTCEARDGSKGTCGTVKTCKSSCDCSTGLTCTNGKCVKTSIPVYCCDRPQACPAGQACDTLAGQREKCPSQQACKAHCDCGQGQFCNNGTCVTGGTAVYCCSKLGCPTNAACFHSDGSVGNCPGKKCSSDTACGKPTCVQQGTQCTQTIPRCKSDGSCANELTTNAGTCIADVGRCKFAPPQCKVNCDCPQGQGCIQGRCIAGIVPVYCCDKAGCPSKQACTKKNGNAGTCPSTPQCKSNSDCGGQSCTQSGSNCIEIFPVCIASGTCSRSAKTVINADCKAGPSGVRQCIPRKPPQCKTNTDCPKTQCSQSGNNCITTSYSCSNGSCVPAPGRIVQNSLCRTSNGVGQCIAKPPQCKIDTDCGKPRCGNQGTSCFQTEPKCSNGQCVGSTRLLPNAQCGPAGKCVKRPPAQCKVDCDCSQGQGCSSGRCVTGIVPVYCCSKTGCPAGKTCTNTNGSKGSCPKPVCQSNADCGRATCRQSGTSCVRTVPSCVNGVCRTSSVTSSGFCNTSSGACTSVAFCKTTCDCPQGQACRQTGPLPIPGQQGVCIRTRTPTYCCDKAGCPSRHACTNKSGGQGFCPALCKSPCDCTAGEDCVGGKCITGTKPVYCCDDAAKCPPGAVCRDKSNKAGTCKKQPRPCKSSCDCIQGEACTKGQCTKSTTPVYCCENTGCPAGKACKDKNGLNGVCPVLCKEHCDCAQGQRCLRGKCTAGSGSVYCCDKKGCPSRYFCYKKGGGTGRCPEQKCASPCDCTQGEDCRGGKCTRVFPAVYCCGAKGCPTGQACKDKSNKWGTCSGTPACQSPCDCPQGRDCYRGQCIQVSPAVYCCTKTGCPAGQTCYDSKNVRNVCPGSQCTTSCDCSRQGQSCVRGRCTYTNPRIYCCSKAGCRAGQTCEDKNGKLGICPGKTCKSACDCNQGQDCRNGSCVSVSPPVYCCSKTGCRAGQACVTATGSSSTCPVQCRVRCDCPQGQDCFRGNCFTRRGAYCCDKPGCPRGQACRTRSNQSGTCGGSTGTTCKVRCDCPQGQECSSGKCVASPFPVYCCDKAGCPSRFICKDKSGKNGFCSSP